MAFLAAHSFFAKNPAKTSLEPLFFDGNVAVL
jgi:hypothetical protein